MKVIGIEYIEDAVRDAVINSEMNDIKNTSIFCRRHERCAFMNSLYRKWQPDVIITDPPRAGMHEDVVKTILSAAPEKIVYVSCNPATQARDISCFQTDYMVIRFSLWICFLIHIMLRMLYF